MRPPASTLRLVRRLGPAPVRSLSMSPRTTRSPAFTSGLSLLRLGARAGLVLACAGGGCAPQPSRTPGPPEVSVESAPGAAARADSTPLTCSEAERDAFWRRGERYGDERYVSTQRDEVTMREQRASSSFVGTVWRAVWLDGRLRVLNVRGVLFSCDLRRCEREAIPDYVQDIAMVGGRLTALFRSSASPLSAQSVWVWEKGAWTRASTLELPSCATTALLTATDTAAVVLGRPGEVFVAEAGAAWARLELAGELWDAEAPPQRAACSSDRRCYAAEVDGERGANLWELDLDAQSARQPTWPEGLGCTRSVNAIVPDPERAGCFLLGMGLHHLSYSSGCFVRVCADGVKDVVRFDFLRDSPLSKKAHPAVQDIAVKDGTVHVLAYGTVYQLPPSGAAPIDVGTLQPRGGVWLNTDLEGLVALSRFPEGYSTDTSPRFLVVR